MACGWFITFFYYMYFLSVWFSLRTNYEKSDMTGRVCQRWRALPFLQRRQKTSCCRGTFELWAKTGNKSV